MRKIENNTVAFIGDKILTTPSGSPDSNLLNVIRTELQLVIEDLYKERKFIFLTGINPGFDMLAAEVVLECAKKYKSIELHAIIPFPGQELCYSDEDKVRYKRIYEAASNHIYLNEEFCMEALMQQMEYLISESSEVVLFCKEITPDVEKLMGEKAWNMYEELEEYFAIKNPIKDFLQGYPNVTSFQYGRKGVCFTQREWLICPAFEDIKLLQLIGNELLITLNDGMKIRASLVMDKVSIDPLPNINMSDSGLPS